MTSAGQWSARLEGFALLAQSTSHNVCAIFAWGNTIWSIVGNFWQAHACRKMVLVNSRNNGSTDAAIITGKSEPLYIFQHMFLQIQKKNSHHDWYSICVKLLTNLPNPWCRVLLENLTGLQLVKEFLAFHGTRRFITALTSVRHLSLSWAGPIQSIYPHPNS